MDEKKSNHTGVALAVSIVLYRSDAALLAGTLDTLNRALEHIRDATLERVEVILVDHSPARQTEQTLSGWQDALGARAKVTYDYVGSNPGFGAGHNRAFARCEAWAQYFLVANPDLEFAPDSIAAGLEFIAEHPDTGLVVPALIEPDNHLRPACFRPPDLLTLLFRVFGGKWAKTRNRHYECRDWEAHDIVFNPPLVSGCCMLFRTAAFARLGGFDTRYFLYFEDFDLSWRAGQLGLSAYCPTMRVCHRGGGAGRKGVAHKVHFLRSALRYFSSHGWRWR